MNSINVMDNIAYQLDTLGKRKPQLRDYLHPVVACLAAFSLLLIDWHGPAHCGWCRLEQVNLAVPER